MRVADYDSISSSGYGVRYRRRKYQGIEAALVSFIAGARPSGLLEVGAGTGHWLNFLADHGCRAIGLDLSATMLAAARQGVPASPLVQGQAELLPFRDDSFDRVVCVNALHHFADKTRFLRDVRRVLGPSGGFMCVGLDPHTGRDRWWVYDYFPETRVLDQERYPSGDGLRAEMAGAGFAGRETREVEHIVDTMSVESARTRGYLDRSFTSQFTILTDEEFGRGMQRIAKATDAAFAVGTTVQLRSDLHLYATIGWAV